MSQIIDFLFSQYSGYSIQNILLEITAVLFAIVSAWASVRNSVWVYPLGIVSTAIFVYLLWQWELLGDMIINMYYFIMSIYGWYIWTRKITPTKTTPISRTDREEHKISAGIFIGTLLFIYSVYEYFDKWTSWTAYVDTLTTAFFFVAMWLLARRKVENWLYLLIGNIISVPLYFYKGYTLSSLLYLIFVFISIFGYFAWMKILNNRQVIPVSKG